MPEPAASSTHSGPDSLDIGLHTDVGRVREANEDAMLVVRADGPRAGQALVAVADGMGGHKAGEVASALAIAALQRALDDVDPSAAPQDLLTHGMQLGNRTIWEEAASDIDKDGMGTTLVCALLGPDGQAVIGNVGDSRAYTVSDGQAALVTADHTWVNQQVISGQMTESEARVSPFRNLLTRSLGSLKNVEIDVFTGVQLRVGDALVLVSDGVTGYLDEIDVATVLGKASSAQVAAERLVKEAVDRGGSDNATAVVVRRTR